MLLVTGMTISRTTALLLIAGAAVTGLRAADRVSNTPALPEAVVKLIRTFRVKAPIIRMQVTESSVYTGYWPDPKKQDNSGENTGEILFESIPNGRFQAKFRDFCFPSSEPSDHGFCRFTQNGAYDGNAYFAIDLPRGHADDKGNSPGLVRVTNQDWIRGQTNQFFPIQCFLPTFEFTSIGGSLDGLPAFAVKVKRSGDELIIENNGVPGGHGDERERLHCRLTPTPQLYKYTDEVTNAKGEPVRETMWTVTQFNDALGLLAFPREIKYEHKKYDLKAPRVLTEETTFEINKVSFEPMDPKKFTPKLAAGSTVSDERLGIKFEVRTTGEDVIRALERIKK